MWFRRKKGPMAAAIMAVLCVGCREKQSGGEPSAPEPIRVTVWKVQTGDITQRIEITGDVRPASTVQLAAKVGGRLEHLGVPDGNGGFIPISEGSLVNEGEVVAEIDRSVYEAKFHQAEAALAMAEAQARDAEREWQRIKRLFDEGSVTEQARDKAETAHKVAAAALAQARAAFELARIEHDESQLKSPVTGVVTHKHVDEGNLVATGSPLLTVEDLAQVKIVAGVAERYLPFLVEGRTRAEIRSDSLPNGMMLTSVVAKIYPSVDPATRNGTIEIQLDNKEGWLRSGNFVRVLLSVAEAKDVVVIPFSAITWQGRDGFVFIVENGRAVRRPIKVGIREMDRCQVVDGLAAGEDLIVEGYRNPNDGDPVQAVFAEGASL